MANLPRNFTLRLAIPDDVPEITEICLATMPTTETWSYCYSLASQYPSDHHFFTSKRLALRTNPATRGNFLVLVAEILEDGVPVVAGYAVWQGPDEGWARNLPGISEGSLSPPTFLSMQEKLVQEEKGMKLHSPGLNDATRRDADPARLQKWREGTARIKQDLSDTKYGSLPLSLIQRAVLPRYQNQGIGTWMLDWGMRIAAEHSWAVTTIVSPKACQWHEKHGFKVLATERLQVVGQEQWVEFLVMGAKPV